MNDKPKPDDDEDQRKTDEVLKRLLHTPPTPHAKKKAKRKAVKKKSKSEKS
jgi:hypothetical protein